MTSTPLPSRGISVRQNLHVSPLTESESDVTAMSSMGEADKVETFELGPLTSGQRRTLTSNGSSALVNVQLLSRASLYIKMDRGDYVVITGHPDACRKAKKLVQRLLKSEGRRDLHSIVESAAESEAESMLTDGESTLT